MKSAIEFAGEHPILTFFLCMMGFDALVQIVALITVHHTVSF